MITSQYHGVISEIFFSFFEKKKIVRDLMIPINEGYAEWSAQAG